ncbi:MAG TPA: TlyA family RNA methyltransferase [Actinomycetota bacterium]|nr:TlyA family RNA methyltransferase [Actinomycetota bacterium]
MVRRRLDAELVRRGLASTRDEAGEAVRAGLVTVGGAPATKAAALVAPEEPLDVASVPREFVSRGALKLRAGLDRFGVDPSGRDCLDAGASTGGFTDCLLRAGAARVAAVDVAYGQLAWSLRTDPRVVVLERTNVRELRADALPFAPTLVVADLSFVSLRSVMPALARVSAVDADFVLLVKPQFEAPPDDVPAGGVVRDPRTWRRAIEGVAIACRGLGVGAQDVAASPLRGSAGNVEFLLHARAGADERALDLEDALEVGRSARG